MLLESNVKSGRNRKKKRTIAQEEKRAQLFNRINDRWVYVQSMEDDMDTYFFLKHRWQTPGSTSKIEQILLSGDPLFDGLYLITDYDIDVVYDDREKKELIELKPRKFDLKVGKYAEDQIAENYDELKNKLVGAKYLTEEEFFIYCQNTKKPKQIDRIILTFDLFKKRR